MKKKLLVIPAVLVVLLVGAHMALSRRSYNVILITIDTQRHDYFSCYNPETPPTPNIDHIAESGVLFTNAYSLIPITLPSHTSMFTSRQPHKMNVFNNGDTFEHKTPMFTDFLRENGYYTGAFISLGVLKSRFGLGGGFQDYFDNFDDNNGRYYKVASEINDLALPWFERNRKKKLFAWLHYSDPHEPYVTVDAPPDTDIFINGKLYAQVCLAKKERINLAFTAQPGENQIEFRPLVDWSQAGTRAKAGGPFIDKQVFVTPQEGSELVWADGWTPVTLKTRGDAEYFVKNAGWKVINHDKTPKDLRVTFFGGVKDPRATVIRKNYIAETQYVDRHIGLLWKKLQDLKLLDKTIIIITADHGESLGMHGGLGHVDKLWNETMHVPLIIYYPWMGRSGKKETKLVNLLDIMPTVLSMVHVKTSTPMEGKNLKPYISRSPLDWIRRDRSERSWTFASTFAPEAVHNSFAVTDGKIKVIHSPTRRSRQWEAYDLIADPRERKSLAKFDPKRFESLAPLKSLLEVHRKEAEAAHDRRKNPALNEEEEQMLRALGYVAGDEEKE